MNSEQNIWPNRNWNIQNFGLGKPGSRSVILTKMMINQGALKTPAGQAALERIKARKKQAIKKGYNSIQKLTTVDQLLGPALATQFGKQNANTNKLRLYLLQKWKRLGGNSPLIALMPMNKLNEKGYLTFGNRTYKTLPQYNLWNPNGTPPNANTLRDHNLIWKAEQMILQRMKNIVTPGKTWDNKPIYEARRLLSQVRNRNSLAYKNINRQLKNEENSQKESVNRRINNSSSLGGLNILEKDLRHSGHLNSTTHGQALRNKLNAKKRQVANQELTQLTNKINKTNSLNMLNTIEKIEKKSGKINNPLIGQRLKEKINAKRLKLQTEQATAVAAKAVAAKEEDKTRANSNFQTYSGWINRPSSMNSLNHAKKLLNNAKAFNHPQYGRNLRAKFNAKKRLLQNKDKAAANSNFQMYSRWINASPSVNGLNDVKTRFNKYKAFNHPQYGRNLRAKFNAKKRQLTQNMNSANNKIYKLITSGTANNLRTIPSELAQLRIKPNAKSQQMARNLVKKYVNLMYGPTGTAKNLPNNYKQQQSKLNMERYGPLHPEMITNTNPWRPSRRGWFW